VTANSLFPSLTWKNDASHLTKLNVQFTKDKGDQYLRIAVKDSLCLSRSISVISALRSHGASAEPCPASLKKGGDFDMAMRILIVGAGAVGGYAFVHLRVYLDGLSKR
jgi:hypothetical protein